MSDLDPDGANQPSAQAEPARQPGFSRRRAMTIPAAVAGAGVGLAAVSADAAAAASGAVSLGKPGTTTVEFRGRVIQSGPSGQTFTSFGYLIRVSGASRSGLFHGTSTSEETALLTAYATGELHARTVDQAVHSLDIVGTMTVYQRTSPGASFGHPASFKAGTPVARYHMTLQDILTVFAPDTGLPTLTGDMVQTAAHALSGPLAGHTFGRRGTRLRFFATGLGHRSDPAPHAQLEIAGNWSIE